MPDSFEFFRLFIHPWMAQVQMNLNMSLDFGLVTHPLLAQLAHIHTQPLALCATLLYHSLQDQVEV